VIAQGVANMRRTTARGRMLPQSLSTDPRYGRLSLKAQALYPLLWINADDQGRLSGDPDEIKYAACPSVREIASEEIPALLELMETKGMIKVYSTSKTEAIQLLDWWGVQRLQWAWPSEYPPPEGWQDRLRYKPTPKEVVTENWLSPSQLGSLPPYPPPSLSPENSPENSPESTPENSPENSASSPLTTPIEKEEEKEKGKGKRRGRGSIPGASPSAPGSRSPPSLTSLSLFQFLTDTFPKAFGRKPDSREIAQLRDLGKEISSAGGATAEQVYDAFKEAAAQNKLHISYIRKILHAWLGLERGPPA